MKFIIAATLLAGAAFVSAQISALPACGITCGLSAAGVTNCMPVTNFNCTCQAANQALIAPVLEACLSKSCTDKADITAAISAGEGICATIVQTAAAASATGSATGSVTATPAAASTSMSSTVTSTAVAVASSTPTAAVTPYTGAAAVPTGIVGGFQAFAAAAGVAMLAL